MLRLLLAEDNDLDRNGLKLLFNHEPDITVVADVANGEEALARLDHIEFDILVTDLNMPVVDGFELIETVKQRRPEVQVVVFTALDSTTHIARAFRAGVSAYLTKDNSSDELIFALRHVGMGKRYLSSDVSLSVFEKYHQFD